jgi:hypothetical protein
MTLYLSSLPVTLHSVENESVPVVLHETDGTVECNIFQESCRRVEIDGALATWDTADCSYDCMELPCEHKFNACALALHYLSNYMTCPVCRKGLRCKMSLECVPQNVKRTYEQHITAPQYTELLEFEPENFLRDLRLHVDFMPWCAESGEVVTLVTPCTKYTFFRNSMSHVARACASALLVHRAITLSTTYAWSCARGYCLVSLGLHSHTTHTEQKGPHTQSTLGYRV